MHVHKNVCIYTFVCLLWKNVHPSVLSGYCTFYILIHIMLLQINKIKSEKQVKDIKIKIKLNQDFPDDLVVKTLPSSAGVQV